MNKLTGKLPSSDARLRQTEHRSVLKLGGHVHTVCLMWCINKSIYWGYAFDLELQRELVSPCN